MNPLKNRFESTNNTSRFYIKILTSTISNYSIAFLSKRGSKYVDYYHTAILPARVLAPKDKASVEGNVSTVTSHIIAKLRNEKFFSIVDMNNAIAELLGKFNAPRPEACFSRLSVFLKEEAPFLQPLPLLPYEYAQWKQVSVQLNYQVSVESPNYSCP